MGNYLFIFTMAGINNFDSINISNSEY